MLFPRDAPRNHRENLLLLSVLRGKDFVAVVGDVTLI